MVDPNLLGPAASPHLPDTEHEPRTVGVLLFCTLVLAHRILEREGVNNGALDLAVCAATSVVGFLWPIGAVAGVLGSTIVGETAAPLGASLSLWLRAALVIRLAVDVLARRVALKRLTSSTFRYWLPFALVVLIAYLVNGSSAGTAFIVKFCLTALFVAGCVAYVRDVNSLLTLQTGLVFTGLVSAAWGVLNVASGGSRSGGLEPNPNYGAAYLCTAFFLALGLMNRKGLVRALSIAAAICVPLGVLASGSRGGAVVLLFGTIAYLLLFGQSAKRYLAVTGLSVIVGVVVLAFLPQLVKQSRFLQTFGSLLRGSTIDPGTGKELDRLPLWRDSIKLWLGHPVLGVGPHNWFEERLVISPTSRTTVPHVYVAQILAELGTLGGVAYLYFLLGSFRTAVIRLRLALQPRSELVTSWTVAGVALAASVFSGSAYSPYLHAVIVIATSASLLDSAPEAESQPLAGLRVDDAEGSESLTREAG